MQVAHVILAHKNPLQVKRLISKLKHPDSLIVLHIDKKADVSQFKNIISSSEVHFVRRRVNVKWGGFSQIEATVNSFLELINIYPDVKYVNLLSGQDYPIKTISAFHAFLNNNEGKAFMEFLLPNDPWVIAAQERFNKYHFSDVEFFGKYRIEKLITSLLPARKFPEGYDLIGKSQWFTIDNESFKFIVDVVKNKKKLYRKFKYSWGADELVFQSILYNSRLRHKIVNNNLRYIDWSQNQSSPKTLTIDDKINLKNTEAFFARKFDMSIDFEILDNLDA